MCARALLDYDSVDAANLGGPLHHKGDDLGETRLDKVGMQGPESGTVWVLAWLVDEVRHLVAQSLQDGARRFCPPRNG